jgi:two-component system, OmpR family, response regulator
MRLLVIEDQKDLSRLLRSMLEEAGYMVDSAVDGAEGLTKATTGTYDAVVLDLMLPKMDGWELLKHLRKTRSTPVLILSARDAISDRCRGLDIGADDYLPKPFVQAELLSRLRSIIRRSAGQSNSELQIDWLSIDFVSKCVRISGEVIPLTAREFHLLEYLALHRGRVVSRAELQNHLSDEMDEVSSNVLDVYVSVLRRKLGHDVIKTRRGFGYFIEN